MNFSPLYSFNKWYKDPSQLIDSNQESLGNFKVLPKEMITEVFKNLDIPHLYQCMNVCHTFAKISGSVIEQKMKEITQLMPEEKFIASTPMFMMSGGGKWPPDNDLLNLRFKDPLIPYLKHTTEELWPYRESGESERKRNKILFDFVRKNCTSWVNNNLDNFDIKIETEKLDMQEYISLIENRQFTLSIDEATPNTGILGRIQNTVSYLFSTLSGLF